MWLLLVLAIGLAATQAASARSARASARRRMRPGGDWEADDVDYWLALIEPFPLPDPTRRKA